MIKETVGNLLDFPKQGTIIAHQVNCKGVMGAGVAKQIKEHLLREEDFQDYRKTCRSSNAQELLGTAQYYPSIRGGFIANLFGENIPTGTGLDTDYEALFKCLQKVHNFARFGQCEIVIPGYLGCGLAGGDWNYVVQTILIPIFGMSDVKLIIVYREDSLKKLQESYQKAPKEDGQLTQSWHLFPKGCSAKAIEIYLDSAKKLLEKTKE